MLRRLQHAEIAAAGFPLALLGSVQLPRLNRLRSGSREDFEVAGVAVFVRGLVGALAPVDTGRFLIV